jgi:hypothetical protein
MTEYYSLESDGPTAHQRRPQYVRDDDWIREVLRHGQVARIGTRWDDQPFVTPTNYYFHEASQRLIFHSNIAGRLRANIERHSRVAAEVSEIGRVLPSNVALEFSQQYRSVMVFGEARLIPDVTEQKDLMHALIAKYFPEMELGKDYRPASESELKRTTVYGLQIESWSGKENWKAQADQSDEWPALDARFMAPGG